jgi:hypothetical protein
MVELNEAFMKRWLRNLVVVVLVAIPFHAFLSVYLSSFVGHYTALRLWKEALLALVIGLVCVFSA